jgi:cellulose synthase/poly-beta-1,6-N-acetylglucosamine synthase-like glycosyltransferase
MKKILPPIAILLLAIAIVPNRFLENNERLAWQLSNLAWIFALLFIAVIFIIFTKHYAKLKNNPNSVHVWLKYAILSITWIICASCVTTCLVICYIAAISRDKKIWANEEYVVYDKSRGIINIDPDLLTLYKRDGLIDRKMYYLRTTGFAQIIKAEYSIYKDSDLIKEEMDYIPFEGNSICHDTNFYRLSDGLRYEQEKNDSLLALIKQ